MLSTLISALIAVLVQQLALWKLSSSSNSQKTAVRKGGMFFKKPWEENQEWIHSLNTFGGVLF
jgi:hypothetical protein